MNINQVLIVVAVLTSFGTLELLASNRTSKLIRLNETHLRETNANSSFTDSLQTRQLEGKVFDKNQKINNGNKGADRINVEGEDEPSLAELEVRARANVDRYVQFERERLQSFGADFEYFEGRHRRAFRNMFNWSWCWRNQIVFDGADYWNWR